MEKSVLVGCIKKKASYLCVGLDTDIQKIPQIFKGDPDPVYAFNKAIIDETADFCVAYKPNLAFYESRGVAGWESLQKTLEYIPQEFFTIADAKRGDIGNTATMYAKAFFDEMDFDAVTVAPYMGSDSVKPFLDFEKKWAIVLGLTSNQGSKDFQLLDVGERKLYEEVIGQSSEWGNEQNLMYVVGATNATYFKVIRKIVPHHFLLVPGVGAQGGSLHEVSKAGLNSEVGLLVNASRSILYASSGKDFAKAAKKEASRLQKEMAVYLDGFKG